LSGPEMDALSDARSLALGLKVSSRPKTSKSAPSALNTAEESKTTQP
jgi:hypothetical protein